MQPCPSARMGVQTEGKTGERNSVLLGETFRGNRQNMFLFDLFLSKCARGKAPRSLVITHQLHPRRDGAACQAKFLGQFYACEAFYCGKHRLRRSASGDTKVTIGPYLSIHAVGGQFLPELLIAHGCHPFFQILYVYKFLHGLRLPQRDSVAQISLTLYSQCTSCNTMANNDYLDFLGIYTYFVPLMSAGCGQQKMEAG